MPAPWDDADPREKGVVLFGGGWGRCGAMPATRGMEILPQDTHGFYLQRDHDERALYRLMRSTGRYRRNTIGRYAIRHTRRLVH